MTWLSLVRRALRLSGVIYSGQAYSAQTDDMAFEAASMLLSAWSRDGVLPPALDTMTITLPSGKIDYTAGPEGDFPMRPLEIDSVMITGGILGSIRNIVRIENWINWNEIALPHVPAIPELIAMNPKFPVADLMIYPAPQGEFELSLSGKFAWPDVLSRRTEEASLPPGFDDTFCDCLADKLASEAQNNSPQQKADIAARASASYKNLLLSLPYWNAVQPNPRAAVLNGTKGTVNWITGMPNQ